MGESKFSCFLCNDRKTRAYFNKNKGIGWCHNCSTIITSDMMETKTGIIGAHDDDYYVTKQEREKILGHIKYDPPCAMFQEDLLEEFLQTRGFIAQGHLENLFPSLAGMKISFSLVSNTRILLSTTMFDRMKIDCVVEPDANPFFLARATKPKHNELKVLFPKKNLIKNSKSHAIVLNRFYELCDKSLSSLKIIPVIVEGDFDAWSTLHKENDKLYVGVGVIGKHLSSTQLTLIKDLSTDRNEIVLCLDGNDKSTAKNEDELMRAVKKHTVDRLTGFYENVRMIELGSHDPNSAYLENKDWFRLALNSSKCYY